jgi:VanZ family protein
VDRKRGFLFAVCAAAVVVASFVPTGTAPEPVRGAHAASDAVWHAATYAALAGVGFYAFGRDRWLVVAVGVVLLGASVEAGQTLVAYRTATVADAVANSVGVAVALVIAETLRPTV